MKPELDFATLDAIPCKQSDSEAAASLNQARRRLFQSIAARQERRA